MTISWLADKIEQWPTAKLVPYARNSRTHSEAQVAQIAASIAEFGFTNPILAGGDGVIVAGHGRLAAAQKLGIPTVPVVVLDHLTPTQRRALVIADNRIAENAGWDDAMLQVELAALQEDNFDLALTGFDADALADLLAGEETITEGDTDDDARANRFSCCFNPRPPLLAGDTASCARLWFCLAFPCKCAYPQNPPTQTLRSIAKGSEKLNHHKAL